MNAVPAATPIQLATKRFADLFARLEAEHATRLAAKLRELDRPSNQETLQP